MRERALGRLGATWSRVTILACACLWGSAFGHQGTPRGLVDHRVWTEGSVQIEVTFNQPGLGTGASTRLQDRIVDLIDQAAPGSSVYLSFYTYRNTAISEALLDAQARGVAVRVIVDHTSLRGDSRAVELLMKGDATRRPLEGCDESCVTICRGGCHGFNINHNKFILFSRLKDGSRWVVTQTSANLTTGQHRHYNDLVVIKNDPRLYGAIHAYFNDLGRGVKKPRYYHRKKGTRGIAVYFFPKLVGQDPLLRILRRVRCDSESVIRVAHSRFDSHRIPVARRLRQLADSGCDVHVVVREEPGARSPGAEVVEQLEGLITILPYKELASRATRNAIHTKLILIKAPYRGFVDPLHLVLTGSHNLSGTSLRLNDEILLRLESEELFAAYKDFWESILEAHGSAQSEP